MFFVLVVTRSDKFRFVKGAEDIPWPPGRKQGPTRAIQEYFSVFFQYFSVPPNQPFFGPAGGVLVQYFFSSCEPPPPLKPHVRT